MFSLFDGDVLDVMFEMLLQDDGTGAPEGLSSTLLDPGRVTTYIGGDGCGLGYGGDASCTSGPALPGWSVELDTLAGDDDCAAVPSGQDFEGFAGFTAATGAGGGTVKVRNVTVIDSTCVR